VTGSTDPLPAFDNPPVIETLLGVQFVPLQSFSILHFGLYARQISSEYPTHEIHPALNPALEDFEASPSAGPRIGISVVAEPDLRCWFIDPTFTQLIQVQRDRFIRNWRKIKPDQVYPHYHDLRPRFQADWERFCLFLQQEGIGTPEVKQCEVTYVNHIELGKGWESYGETDKAIRLVSAPTAGGFLGQPEVVHLNTSYVMPEKKGRLHVVVQPVISRPLGKEVIQLTLTARGRPVASGLRDLLEWFDLGHEWVVRGFAELTTREMHATWGRTL
jgi:uncharacterized protein (TIGR04255 family)